MENRKKFYANYGSRKQTGAWGADTLQKRYDHVCGALDAYKSGILDDMDLTFAIKNAFVSKVYVSCGVVKAYPSALPGFGSLLSGLYNRIVKNGVLDLKPTNPSSSALHCDYLNICELGTKVNSSAKAGTLPACIHIEHTVPGDVYMNDAKNQFNRGKFGLNEFIEIFNAVSICLVTEGEDKLLNQYRNALPNGVDYKTNPFARYDATGVKIWERCAHCNQCHGYDATEVKIWKHCAHCNQCPGVDNCKNLTFMTQPISFGSSQYWINPKNDKELLCSPKGNSITLNGKIFDLLLSGDKNHKKMKIYTDHGIYVLDLQGNIKRIKP